MSEPGTCAAGYNNLRADEEFTRYSFYRNFLDPYSREGKNGNSRWDLLDLVRATGALRRDGINWPQEEEGLPVYKWEELTKHNGIEHGSAHDALSEVRATIGIAKLNYQNHPKNTEYYPAWRDKKQGRKTLEPDGIKTCLHISGINPRARSGVAPVISLARHPTNNNAVIVAELAEEMDSLITMTPEEIKSRQYSKE
jgi:Exonuclease I